MQTITIERKVSQKRALVAVGVTVKFGLDVHAAQITVCRQVGGQVLQPAQRMSWADCMEWISAHGKAGAVVYACSEAGPCGYVHTISDPTKSYTDNRMVAGGPALDKDRRNDQCNELEGLSVYISVLHRRSAICAICKRINLQLVCGKGLRDTYSYPYPQ